MKYTWTSLLTIAGFSAGFAVLRLWPRESPDGTPRPSRLTAASDQHSASGPQPPRSPLSRRLAVKRRADAMSLAEVRTVIEQLGYPWPVPPDQVEWLTAILGRWASLEPEAATTWLRTWSSHGEPPSEWVYAVLRPLAAKDLRAALTASRFFGGRWSQYGGALAEAARTHPAAALALAEKNSYFASSAGPAFTVWLQHDPAAACEWLIHSSFRNAGAIGDMVADLSQIAPDRLPAVLAALPPGSDARESALSSLAASEVDHDPAAALTKFPSLSAEERYRMIQPLSRQLSVRGQPDDVTAFLAGLKPNERSSALEEFREEISSLTPERTLTLLGLPGLIETEKGNLFLSADTLGPQSAAEFMAAVKNNTLGSSSGVLNFWDRNLQSQPEETLAALHSLAASGQVDPGVLLDLTSSLSRQSGDIVEKMIAALPESQRTGPQAVRALQTALTTPGSDLSAFTSLTDGEVRANVLRSVFSSSGNSWDSSQRTGLILQLPGDQPFWVMQGVPLRKEDVAALTPSVEAALGTRPDDTTALNGPLSALVSAMADPAAAMQWIDSLPDGSVRDFARRQNFSGLVYRDSVAASEWLNAQPLTIPHRDTMVESLVHRIIDNDPESALQWAATIQDEDSRHGMESYVQSRLNVKTPTSSATPSQ